MRSIRSFPILLILFLVCLGGISPFWAQEATESPNSAVADIVTLYPDRWYRMEQQGQMTGYSRVQLSWVEHQGQQVIRDQTEFVQLSRRKIAHMNDVFSSTTQVDILRTADGELLREKVLSQEGSGRDIRYIQTFLEKTAEGYSHSIELLDYRKKTIGAPKTKIHPISQKVSLDSEAALIPFVQSGAIHSTTAEFYLMDGETGTLYKNEAIKVAPEKIRVAGVETDCIGIQILNTVNQYKSYMYFQEDGLLTRIYSGDSSTYYCTEDEIKQEVYDFKKGKVSASALPALETAIHTSPDLPGAFSLKTFTVELTVKKRPRVEIPDPPVNHYQELLEKKEGKDRNIYRLKLKAFNKEVTTAYPIPYNPEFEEYLKATPLMQVDDPLVKETALKIVEGETDARQAAHKIADFVYLSLSKGNSGVIGQYSAVEILKNRYGDCSEHCLLFTALCRAAGIPAKRVSGLVCLGNLWGPHAWTEIWVGDWIGTDPTTGDIGSVARYFFAGYPDDPNSSIGIISQGFYGYTSMRLLAASFGNGDEVDLTGKEKLYGMNEDGAFNYIAGVAIQKRREDWRLSSYSNRMGLQSEHLSVDIYVSPDQGARHLDSSGWVPGKISYPIIQGVTTKMGDDLIGKSTWRRTLFVPSDRRSIYIRARLTGETPEEREALWSEFLQALDLNGWKNAPKPQPEEALIKEPKTGENWSEFFQRIEENLQGPK